MLTGRAGRRVAGLGPHSADLQHAHSGLLQYGVVQQLWADNSVQLQHSANAMDHSSGTTTVHNNAAARRHATDRVRWSSRQDQTYLRR
jgi:hypothetical protein